MSVTVLWTYVDAWVWQYCVTMLYGESKMDQYKRGTYKGWNFNSGNYLFTADTK